VLIITKANVRNEITEIYYRKGFRGDLLEKIVNTITANREIWVAVMMAEEHQLTPTDRTKALISAFIVGISAIIGSLIPIIPFLLLPVKSSMIAALLLAAIVLFFVGVIKARLTVGDPGKSGLEMAIIGTLSALVGYAVGVILKIPSSP